MHVESSTEPGKAPKHAGQKKTYRAIAETYAFLPREAVTRFLMSCTECQKRMHFNSNGLEPKESEPPSSLVSGIIDYNMPLTSTYLKQMKLRVMNSQEQECALALLLDEQIHCTAHENTPEDCDQSTCPAGTKRGPAEATHRCWPRP
ncbi:nucleolar protein 4-like [Meleagris gallopavo]|uniref:nucleolar protein 4-like n=1 Tax=Meleagris gallopavo TaxID=9103 RepID=UPI0012ABB339|nr:nucleolar protein 4-like [Meleagris gallopavo]